MPSKLALAGDRTKSVRPFSSRIKSTRRAHVLGDVASLYLAIRARRRRASIAPIHRLKDKLAASADDGR